MCSYMLRDDAPYGRKRPNAPLPPPRPSGALTPKHHSPTEYWPTSVCSLLPDPVDGSITFRLVAVVLT